MGYANPDRGDGRRALRRAAAEAGVDGVLVVDYPPEECQSLPPAARRPGSIRSSCWRPPPPSSALPTSPVAGSGYIYYVSLKGVTGSATLDPTKWRGASRPSATRSGMPVGVGFGIRDARAPPRASPASADAVVIGSRIIEEIEKSP